ATASIAAWRGGADPWRMFGSVFWDACTTAVFYGLLTLVVLRWDQYWLTVPAAVLVAFLVLITLVVTAEVGFGAVPLVVMRPRPSRRRCLVPSASRAARLMLPRAGARRHYPPRRWQFR